ncbi:MAG: pilus assembly protein PilP [Acidobacteriota bacterium]|nr:pilus assembly protein PilP [Acidobacteriota bacterium]
MIAALLISLVSLAQAGAPSQTAPPQSENRQAPAWTYDPQGRRDPFVSLRGTGGGMTSTQNRPSGLAGVSVTEIVVRGVVRSGNEFVALAQSPDGRTFQLRRNDRLFDGSVKQVGIDAVVFVQQVNDPLSLVKQREVRKTMKTGDREEEL